MDTVVNKNLWSYLAGFIDADGTITIGLRSRTLKDGTKRTKYIAELYISNCSVLLMNFLQTIIKGKISTNDNEKHSKWRRCYVWTLYNKNAMKIIENVYPYLIVKKSQAKLLLELQSIKSKYSQGYKRWHPEAYEECVNKYNILKKQCLELNIRGTKRKEEYINIDTIPNNIAYMAGFCDADGSLMLIKQGKKVCIPKINITNTNSNIIQWILNNYEGSLYTKNSKNKNWNTAYSITLTSKKAINFLEKIAPFLIVKKEQANLLMQANQIIDKYKYMARNDDINRQLNEVKMKCQKLNKRGA